MRLMHVIMDSKKIALLLAFGCLIAFANCEVGNDGDSGNALTHELKPSQADADEPTTAASATATRKESKPDFFLGWISIYESLIPSNIMDQIDSIRPQTESISSQMVEQMPGMDMAWSQMNSFFQTMSSFMNGGAQIPGLGGGSNSGRVTSGLAGLLGSLGR